MKIKVYTVIFLLIILFTSFGASEAYAWDDCPKGLVNDPYPGECSRYIDTDENGICDHSEPAPEDREPLGEDQSLDGEETVLRENDIQNDEKSKTPESVVAGSRVENPTNRIFMGFMAIVIPLLALIGYVTIKRFTGKVSQNG